jgi:hypothetical protein
MEYQNLGPSCFIYIETGEGFERVIGFTKNGEVLLTKDEKMFSYEPSGQ